MGVLAGSCWKPPLASELAGRKKPMDLPVKGLTSVLSSVVMLVSVTLGEAEALVGGVERVRLAGLAVEMSPLELVRFVAVRDRPSAVAASSRAREMNRSKRMAQRLLCSRG
jgi:hypothetical protein